MTNGVPVQVCAANPSETPGTPSSPRMMRAKPAQRMKLMITTIITNVSAELSEAGMIAASASRK